MIFALILIFKHYIEMLLIIMNFFYIFLNFALRKMKYLVNPAHTPA